VSLKLKQIAVSDENYRILKSLGKAGDSFNDVVTQMLKSIKSQQSDFRVGPSNQTAADHNTVFGTGCKHE